MSGDWSIVIEGDPNVYTTAGVSSISSYSDATPAGSTVREGVLGSVDVTLSERLRRRARSAARAARADQAGGRLTLYSAPCARCACCAPTDTRGRSAVGSLALSL